MIRIAMSRPVLGVICCNRAVGTETAQAVMQRYVTAAIRHADTAAVLIPSLPGMMRADEVAPRIDGLLLTGSPSNVEPHRYGHGDAEDAYGPFDPDRDEMTFGLIRAMIARRRPVFGICRGFQELNLAFGGSLRRDCASHPDLIRHHTPDEVGFDEMFDLTHPVDLTPGGLLAGAYGREALQVNSVHFQGVDRLGEGLQVEARAPDGLIEAVSGTFGDAQVLAVQWHPEWQVDRHPDSQRFFHLLGDALRA
jgi:putative glutamine amidotransferase